ncbi:MAG TPA: hypothetical protein VN811_16990 [Thermoanaerobaculia bacterium]|nr:hypothetical protein [Thermoanaerobaculia bacterium]
MAAKPKKAAKKTAAKKSSAKKAAGARTAKSIRRADLQKLTAAAVKATVNRPVKIIREPIWGFVLDTEAGAIETANVVTQRLSEGARKVGVGLTAEPSVLHRKGVIIAGYIQADLNIPVRF